MRAWNLFKLGAALVISGSVLFSQGAVATGVYAGVSIGTSRVQEETPSGERYDGYGGASAGLFGGFSFGETFALEAGLRNYGNFVVDSGATRVETDLHAFTAGPVLRLPLSHDVRLSGRLDFIDWRIEQSVDGYEEREETGSTMGIALGFEADIGDGFGLRAGVDIFGFETEDRFRHNVTNFSIGALVTF
ncbi:outer membrane beta-barrel protein [Ectothiorhodospiraceae bacterium WFHF3C12]|nr:outer membrane beta-barrel protein [Ectothiorhodospiraceae bacterium WFHF3C12]